MSGFSAAGFGRYGMWSTTGPMPDASSVLLNEIAAPSEIGFAAQTRGLLVNI